MAYLDYSGSTSGKVAFLDKIKVMLSELYTTYVAEIVAARDGESTLLAKVNALKADISLLGDAELPGQTGNSGKFLTTDGSVSTWTDSPTGFTFVASKYEQIADASLGTGTHTFDYSSGDMQQLTATGDITLAFSNFPTGKVATMIIDAVNWGAHTITHPAGILFETGVAPSYTTAGTDRLQIVKDKDDVYGLFIIGQDIKAVA